MQNPNKIHVRCEPVKVPFNVGGFRFEAIPHGDLISDGATQMVIAQVVRGYYRSKAATAIAKVTVEGELSEALNLEKLFGAKSQKLKVQKKIVIEGRTVIPYLS